ncbi:MAG: tyrosine-protein phosphatase [Chitinispirillaceae bacterium]|nr:tyrosine-protein phosphatase [Chitinispirillaceae bacterium]
MNNSINFRDCGGLETPDGLRVKRGMLYRSGSLDRLSARNRRMVRAANLKTIIDLRPDSERPKRIADLPGVRRLSIPLDVDRITRNRILPFFNKRHGEGRLVEEIASVYHDVVALSAAPLRVIFDRLADAGAYPLCINCRAGKDRTGYAIAIILRTLGVPDSEIIGDYLATNRFLLPQARRITRPLRLLSLGLLPTRTWEAAITAYKHYLRTAFAAIDSEYGGTAEYLDFCGIAEERRSRLKELLCG